MIFAIILTIISLGSNTYGEPCQCSFYQTNDENDYDCYGSYPIVAGLHAINADPGLEHGKQQLTLIEVMERACFEADKAEVMEFDTEQAATARSKFFLDRHAYSIFFIKLEDETGKRVDGQYECSFFFENGTAALGMDCDTVPALYRRTKLMLCRAEMIDGMTWEKRLEDCKCPCDFVQDEHDMCTRDYQRCTALEDTEEIYETCSAAKLGPSYPARTANASTMSEHWRDSALLFFGPSDLLNSEPDTAACGLRFADNNSVIHSPRNACIEWLRDFEFELDGIFVDYVLCMSPKVNMSGKQDCGPDEEVWALDAANCGAIDVFGDTKWFVFIAIALSAFVTMVRQIDFGYLIGSHDQ